MKQLTLSQFVNKNNADLGEGFAQILHALEDATKKIYLKLHQTTLVNESGKTGNVNVYGEEVQKLDQYADAVLTDSLLGTSSVFAVASEELPEPRFSSHKNSLFFVTYDPVDGSSNIDTCVPIGTIFGIYPKGKHLLQKGSELIASGYVLYGPSMMFVYAVKDKVNGFTYSQATDDFVLTYENIRIGDKKYYSLNEGNWQLFSQQDKAYLNCLKSEGRHSARYVGTMVADVHRTLIKGGIFLYPADSKHPNGKLRLLYEVAPLSYLIMQAGGDATSGGKNPLDLEPQKHDQRVPIALGTKEEVRKYLSFLTKW